VGGQFGWEGGGLRCDLTTGVTVVSKRGKDPGSRVVKEGLVGPCGVIMNEEERAGWDGGLELGACNGPPKGLMIGLGVGATVGLGEPCPRG